MMLGSLRFSSPKALVGEYPGDHAATAARVNAAPMRNTPAGTSRPNDNPLVVNGPHHGFLEEDRLRGATARRAHFTALAMINALRDGRSRRRFRGGVEVEDRPLPIVQQSPMRPGALVPSGLVYTPSKGTASGWGTANGSP